jgi:uncharacterized membrane protein
MSETHPHTGSHSRVQFQIDRIAFFSDAVIAIAITLLLLEVKIPPLGFNTTWHEIFSRYGGNFFQHLIALFICFLAIGNLWISHHTLFEYVNNYNKRLIKLNLYFLLAIILLPVTISFNLEPNNPPSIRLFILIFNLFLCNLFFYGMLVVITRKQNGFYFAGSQFRIKKIKHDSLLASITLFFVAVVSLIDVERFYLPFAIIVVDRIVTRIRKKKGIENGENPRA